MSETANTEQPTQAPVRVAKQLLNQMQPAVIIKLAESLFYLEQVLAETPKPEVKPDDKANGFGVEGALQMKLTKACRLVEKGE